MTARRWWLLAVAGTSVALRRSCSGSASGSAPRFWIGVGILVAFTVFWARGRRPARRGGHAALGRRAGRDDRWSTGALHRDRHLARLLPGDRLPGGVDAAGQHPPVGRSRAPCIAVVVGVALPDPARDSRRGPIALAVAIEGISFVFAIAMGVWISRHRRPRPRAQAAARRAHRGAGAARGAAPGCRGHRRARAPGPRTARHDRADPHRAGAARAAGPAGAGGGDARPTTRWRLHRERVPRRAHRDALARRGERARRAAGRRARRAPSSSSPTRFERESGITVAVERARSSEPLDRDTEVVLLRCAQEGLANVRKHAGAHAVRVELSCRRRASPAVRVVDDGHGFEPATAASAGFGLSGLRDRLGLVGGALADRRHAGRDHADRARSGAASGRVVTRVAIRALVVDDHPIVRAGLVALLDAAPDIEVVGTASSGEAGDRAGGAAAARRRADGPADAGHRRRRGDRAHRRGRGTGDPGDHPDHLRERRRDPARDRGRGERLPAQGGPRGGAAGRRPRGRRRRGGARSERAADCSCSAPPRRPPPRRRP